jgi:type II secretory pathway pseudopilin PulG
MNLMQLKKLSILAAFVLLFGAQHASADDQGGTQATNQGSSNNVTDTVNKDDESATNVEKPMRKSKQSGKSRDSAKKKSSTGENADSSTIGKGTGTPDTTTSGSGTGYRGKTN